MSTFTTTSAIGALLIISGFLWFAGTHSGKLKDQQALSSNELKNATMNTSTQAAVTQTALFAGGCFWCVEADFEKLSGIQEAVSGYAGGTQDNPTYENYATSGHREVVQVTYDSEKTSYESLVEHSIRYSDPTDATGSFHDRGQQYAPAIYFETEEEKNIAEGVIRKIDAEGVYEKPITIEVLPRVKFWPAEEYHQDYAVKNPLRYKFYRHGSGRDAFIEKHSPVSEMTQEKAESAATSDQQTGDTEGVRKAVPVVHMPDARNYQKPSSEQLRATLTPLQYKVTQEEGTEKPFENEYNNEKAEGIYVDRISGEPLYSSRDKYDSGTGWPSFVKPIQNDAITLHEDNGLFTSRTEVRSHLADSHLGHVFDDGPQEKGGKRYCMNSAALLFIPKEELQTKGYGEYLQLFNESL